MGCEYRGSSGSTWREVLSRGKESLRVQEREREREREREKKKEKEKNVSMD